MGGPTGGSSAGAQRMRLSPEASGGMGLRRCKTTSCPITTQHHPSDRLFACQSIRASQEGAFVKITRRSSDCENDSIVWGGAGAHQVLAGAELPGAVPRQAAAPGHGPGGHFRADWTPHLPSAASIACHQITKGSSRRVFQIGGCATAVQAGLWALQDCNGIATCMKQLVMMVHIASCRSSVQLSACRHWSALVS